MPFPRHRKVLLASAIALATQASLVQAAGFSVNEHSASAMGSAYAGRASFAEDASVGAANPAAIAQLDRQQITLGGAVVLEAGNFDKGNYSNANVPESSADSKDFLKTSAIPFGHFVLPINDRLSYGLNIYAPFGLNLDYDDSFAGRYFGDKTLIQNINLQNTLAYKVQDNLSVGIGLTASYLKGELTQKAYGGAPLPGLNNIDSTMKGDDLAFTWNIGAVWQPVAGTTLGMAYHAETRFKLEGDIEASNFKHPAAGSLNFTHKGKLKVTMPERIMLSATQQLDEQWTLMADATWTRWSRMDTIMIVDKEPQTLPNGIPLSGDKYVPMNWRDVWALSFGTAYKLNDQWTLKAGYMFDQSPTTNANRTVRAPDNDRNWFTVGAKWDATDNLTVDASAAYVMLKDGTISEIAYEKDGSEKAGYGELTGEYKDQASWVLSTQMTYRF